MRDLRSKVTEMDVKLMLEKDRFHDCLHASPHDDECVKKYHQRAMPLYRIRELAASHLEEMEAQLVPPEEMPYAPQECRGRHEDMIQLFR